MLHINTFQIDNHCWNLVVSDGFHTHWNATLNSSDLVIRYGENAHGKIMGQAKIKSTSEGEAIGAAMQLVFNWAQIYPQCNEKLDPRWEICDSSLIHHLDKQTNVGVSTNPR